MPNEHPIVFTFSCTSFPARNPKRKASEPCGGSTVEAEGIPRNDLDATTGDLQWKPAYRHGNHQGIRVLSGGRISSGLFAEESWRLQLPLPAELNYLNYVATPCLAVAMLVTLTAKAACSADLLSSSERQTLLFELYTSEGCSLAASGFTILNKQIIK